ncbi:MAG TPA: hypothetical protein VJY66_03940, partial [Acholeplasma sp.]|nr:hypothetical protein [Acholeplasma sp.]
MKTALVIVLNDIKFLEDILSSFIELGVGGATIIDSQGMASAIVNGKSVNIPLFGSLKKLLEGTHPYNKTIFAVIDGDDLLEKVIDEIQEIMNDHKGPGAGFMFTMPVSNVMRLG